MEKSFPVGEVKTLGEAGSGQFEALVSVFDNVDGVKDVVMGHSFNRAFKEQDPPPIVWSHHWHIPPVGNTLDWGSLPGKGLSVKGELFVGADDNHSYADMVYAGMKSREGRKPALREFSFSYDIPDGGAKIAEREVEGKRVQVQELHELFPIHEVGPTFKGCNALTELTVPPKTGQSGAPELERLKAIALALGKTVGDLLKELEDEHEIKMGRAVRAGIYPPEVAELLLAYPGH